MEAVKTRDQFFEPDLRSVSFAKSTCKLAKRNR